MARFIFFFVFLLPLIEWAQDKPFLPKVPPDSVYKPTFMTGYASLTGGTSFLCTVPDVDGVFMLTAHNIFGKACGWPQEVAWDDLPKIFVAMTALSMQNFKHTVTSISPQAIPGAHTYDKTGYSNDLAAYLVDPSLSGSAFSLATVRPPVDSIVYLLARQHGKEDLELMRAVVTKSTETEFEYRYFSIGLNILGTSGAPVLNKDGEVVAVNIGGDLDHGRWGIGNPCTSVLQLLKSIMRDDSEPEKIQPVSQEPSSPIPSPLLNTPQKNVP